LPDAPLLRQFTALSLANVVAAVTSFLSLAVVARVLSAERFGQLVFAQATAAAAFALLDPRLEDALQRFVPIVRRARGDGAASRLFERVALLDQGANLGFGALGLAVLLTGAVSGNGIADPALLAPAIVQMAAQGPVGTFGAGYALTDGLATWGLLRIASVVTMTAASLIGLAVGGAVGFLTGGAIAAVLTTAVLWLATIRRTRRAYGAPSGVRHPLPPGFLSFTVKAAANSSILIGGEAFPLTVVGLRADAATLGAFRVALSPARLVAAFVSPVASIVYPRASRASAEQRAGVAAAEALRFTRRVALVAAAVLCVGVIAMPAAITLAFGHSFRSASTTATILLAAALIRGTVAWSKTLPLALGDATRRLVVSLLDAVALVTAAVVLAATPHALGVAVAYLAIALAVAAYWLNYARVKATAA
jgi:O-antigen/teichoic acid export membrane protein